MHNDEKLIIAGSLGLVACATYSIIQNRKKQKLIRETITLQMESDIINIKHAAEIVQEKITKGHYDQTGIKQILTDLKFFEIALNNQ